MNNLSETEKKAAKVLSNIATIIITIGIIVAGIFGITIIVNQFGYYDGTEIFDFTFLITVLYGITAIASKFLIKQGTIKILNIINLALSVILLTVLLSITVVLYAVSFF